LLDLLKYQKEEEIKLQELHLLAKVSFNLKDYEEAEKWCLEAVKGRQSMLGKEHHLFYESVNLLTQIFQARGDHVGAKTYSAVLKDLPPGLKRYLY
jgi:hypothetical protein